MIAVALPLRRSWLAEQLQPRVAAGKFLQILQAIAPAKARAVRGESGAYIYHALLEHLATLMPIYEPVFNDNPYQDQGDVFDEVEEALEYGIPMEFYGFDESAIAYNDGYDPALALVYWLIVDIDSMNWEGEGTDRDPYQLQPDSRLPEVLKPYAGALIDRFDHAAAKRWTLPPRGRQWKGVWAFLPDLYAYVTHQTGCGLLDYAQNNIYEMGDMPPWDVDEVKGAIQDWKRGAPMWEGIKAIVEYVGDDRARLLELGLALTGDDATRQLLSEPKRKGKTLAQIFAKGARHA
jgi:hypothetical protein